MWTFRTCTEQVHPAACKSQTLHYKWVYAAVIYRNEAFFKKFSSLYPNKTISLVMQTPALIMSCGYDSTASRTFKCVLENFFVFTANEHLLCPVQMSSAQAAALHRCRKGSPCIHCVAPAVGLTAVVAVRLRDLSDGTIACVPEEMPGFIWTAILLNIFESVSSDLLFSRESVSEILISWLIW